MCVYKKSIYCESLTDKRQLISAITESCGTFVKPSVWSQTLRECSHSRKFLTVGVLRALMGFGGPDQPHLGSCPHPSHVHRRQFKPSPRGFFLSWVAGMLVFSLVTATPVLSHGTWAPTCGLTSWPWPFLITTQVIPDSLGSCLTPGCHPEACSSCCAWLQGSAPCLGGQVCYCGLGTHQPALTVALPLPLR